AGATDQTPPTEWHLELQPEWREVALRAPEARRTVPASGRGLLCRSASDRRLRQPTNGSTRASAHPIGVGQLEAELSVGLLARGTEHREPHRHAPSILQNRGAAPDSAFADAARHPPE